MTVPHMPPSVTVVPCYNEEHRLQRSMVIELSALTDGHVLLVNDGSTDRTAHLIDELADDVPARIHALHLPTNQGKAEAVRSGILAALDWKPAVVAYCDADFAAPPGEVARLITTLTEHGELQAVLGSRVAMLGTNIDRSPARHYLGRFFATAASLTIGMPVYDTQCGAKAFRVTPTLLAAMSTPFPSRWAFDVELLSRLHRPLSPVPAVPLEQFREVPLHCWRDMRHSKLTIGAALRSGVDLVRLGYRLRRPQGSKSSSAA
jgi:dolichyl-phosphate beta-glucosyltransferase